VCIDVSPPVDLEAALKNVDSYLGSLRARFDADKLDEELEAQAYAFFVEPPAMQDLIVRHLCKMRDEHTRTREMFCFRPKSELSGQVGLQG
jgi:hypothetical protein